jgi:hypothetical protein
MYSLGALLYSEVEKLLCWSVLQLVSALRTSWLFRTAACSVSCLPLAFHLRSTHVLMLKWISRMKGSSPSIWHLQPWRVWAGGTRWRSWLRHCATSRKIPDGVTGIFQWQSFRSHCDSGVDLASNRNEYQESFLGVKTAVAYGWRPYHLHVPIV